MAKKNDGGWFRGKPWVDEGSTNGDRFCFMVCWGEVITPKRAAETVTVTSFQNRYGYTNYKVECVIAMMGKNYEKLVSWGENDTTNTMSKLQEGDRVACFGKEKTYHYKTKDGTEKEARELSVFWIVAQAHAASIEEVVSNPDIIHFLEQGAAANAALPEDATENNGYDAEYEAEPDFDPDDDFTENPEASGDEEGYYEDPDEYMENPDLPEPPFA